MTADALLTAIATTTGQVINESWTILFAVIGTMLALWAGYAIVGAIVAAIRYSNSR